LAFGRESRLTRIRVEPAGDSTESPRYPAFLQVSSRSLKLFRTAFEFETDA
jgi:hypothetical protein